MSVEFDPRYSSSTDYYRSRFQTTARKDDGNQTSSKGDSLSISDQARQAGRLKGKAVEEVSTIQGVGGSDLRRYIDIGSGPGKTSLDYMNVSRDTLGSRIDAVLRSKGIKLGKDEKLTISVGNDNQIVVGGIKDTKKAEKIQEALNTDPKLGRDLRRHAALGVVNQNAKRQKAAEENGMPGDTEDVFTNRAVRSFVIDDLLQENASTNLNALSVGRNSDGTEYIDGMTEELSTMIGQDPSLETTILDILNKGETNLEFKAAFEFANGALSDSASTNVAADKVGAIKAKLMGGVNPETGELEFGAINDYLRKIKQEEDVDPEFLNALQKGFRIRVDASGGFEIVGAENLDYKTKSTLNSLVQKALDEYAGKGPDGTGQSNGKTSSLGDVAKAYIDQHQFEHGDTDEYAHMLEINFSHEGDLVRVVSPEADAAQDKKNQQVASEMGQALRSILEDEGINTAGLDMVVDKDGKITVQGDPNDANVRKAQTIVDQIVKEAKTSVKGNGKAEAEDKKAASEAREEANRIRSGEDKEETGTTYSLGSVVAEGESEQESIIADLPKYDQSVQSMIVGKLVSDVTPTWNMPFASQAEESSTGLESDREKAVALYRQLVQGLGNFHEKNRDVSYSLSA